MARSASHSSRVVRLKPKRTSIPKVCQYENGSPMIARDQRDGDDQREIAGHAAERKHVGPGDERREHAAQREGEQSTDASTSVSAIPKRVRAIV